MRYCFADEHPIRSVSPELLLDHPGNLIFTDQLSLAALGSWVESSVLAGIHGIL
jgi:hypothetical protein